MRSPADQGEMDLWPRHGVRVYVVMNLRQLGPVGAVLYTPTRPPNCTRVAGEDIALGLTHALPCAIRDGGCSEAAVALCLLLLRNMWDESTAGATTCAIGGDAEARRRPARQGRNAGDIRARTAQQPRDGQLRAVTAGTSVRRAYPDMLDVQRSGNSAGLSGRRIRQPPTWLPRSAYASLDCVWVVRYP